MNKIITLLETQIQNTERNKSSSYEKYLKNVNYKNIYSQFATGGFEKKPCSKVYLIFLSRILFKFSIFSSKNFKKLTQINNRLKVSLNINMIWHVIILNLLKKK